MAEEIITDSPGLFRRVSWAAIFGGVLTALGMEVMLALFGFFIGFKLTPNGAISWSEAWYLVTSFVALFVGSIVAAKIAANPNRGSGILHGIVTWGLTTVATFAIVLTLAWGLIGGTIQMARAAVVAGGEVAPAVAANTPPAEQQQAQQQAANVANNLQQNGAQIAHNVASQVSSIALVLWGGVLLGFCSAIVGGIAGTRRYVARRVPA